MKTTILSMLRGALRLANFSAPVGDLLLRAWVGYAFFASGLTKIQSWDTTVLLFQYEYQVPVLPPAVAAMLSAFGELCFPVLLVLGIGGRFAAAGLFVVNLVAVLSYPGLNEAGVFMHQAWGLALLVLVLRGPGALSLDHFAGRRLGLV